MYFDRDYEERIPSYLKQCFLKLMYYYDPYMYGLHPERRCIETSFARYFLVDVTKEMAERAVIRKRHEYFLFHHICYPYSKVPGFCSETLWKAKQFQFRAVTDEDFGFYDVFKKHMTEVYIPSREKYFPEKEIKEIKNFVETAKPEDFLVMDPSTKKFVQYNERSFRRIYNYVRDLIVPHYGTHQIGMHPNYDVFVNTPEEYKWYVNILHGVE